VQWTQPQGKPITVSLLQGNVAQDVKFSEGHIVDSLNLYDAMVKAAPADLVATPETALPILSSQLPPDYLQRIADFARRSNSHVVLGMVAADPGEHYANSAFGYSPEYSPEQGQSGSDGQAQLNYRYDKHHLVPFGEFVPNGFHWFVDLMKIPLGDFTRGGLLQAPFKVKDQYVLPDICYEDLFGDEIAAQLEAQSSSGQPVASMLLNVSNLAWYGDTNAMPQHLQISQMRSLETGRPMLRATNTGATAVIAADGSVQAKLDFWRRDTLRATVQGTTGLTPYIRYGNLVMLSMAALALVAAWLLRVRRWF
jgi:apolipoprotein N-acyltransferase